MARSLLAPWIGGAGCPHHAARGLPFLYRTGSPRRKSAVRSIPFLLYDTGATKHAGRRSMLAFWIGGAAGRVTATDYLLDNAGGDLLDSSGGKLLDR